METINKRRVRWQDMAFFAVLLAAVAFLLWKCQFGVAKFDECFYLQIPYRLYMGDALFVDEWNLCQMSSTLMLPFVSALVSLMGTTDGLVLAMRYVCVLVQTAIAITVYLRARRISPVGAAVAALSFVLYVPYGIMSLSYNSMGIMLMVLACTLFLTAQSKAAFIAGGLAFAGAVLCCPYLAAVYGIYLAVVWVKHLVCRRRGITPEKNDLYSPASALYVTIGAGVAAVALITFAFSRAPLGRILEAMPYIFDDPLHMTRTFWEICKRYAKKLLLFHPQAIKVYAAYVLLVGVTFIDRGRKKRRWLYFLLSAGCVSVLMDLYFRQSYINYLMWSMSLLAVPMVLLSDEKICRRIFWTVWAPGMLYTFCMNAASDQGLYAITSSATVSTVGTLIMLAVFVRELMADESPILLRRLCAFVAAVMMLFQLGTETILRYQSVFWEEGGMAAQTVRMEEGVNKGLMVSESSHDYYHRVVHNLKVLDDYDIEKILYLTNDTTYYFIRDYEIAAYSTWLSDMGDHTFRQLKGYYELNPEKLPDVVYAEKQHAQLAQRLADEIGYTFVDVPGGIVLRK